MKATVNELNELKQLMKLKDKCNAIIIIRIPSRARSNNDG